MWFKGANYYNPFLYEFQVPTLGSVGFLKYRKLAELNVSVAKPIEGDGIDFF